MKIVFVGNCQASAIRKLYDLYVQPYSLAESFYVESYKHPTEADKALVSSADVIAVQAQDFTPKAGPLAFPDGVLQYRFPIAAGNFLWPFSGRERPGNKPAPGFPRGPFPSQMGDSYLNRLIREGRDVDLAVRDYTALDVSAVVDLDRLFNINTTKQKRLDDELGYGIASIITQHFRDEPLFRTSYHPETRIVVHLAVTLFRQMGVSEDILRRIERWQRHPGLPPPECPVHPSVARHFGLHYIDGSTKYRLHDEGRYPFLGWVQRYLAGDWNRLLAEGIDHTTKNRPPGQTQVLLEGGLASSPASGRGWQALSINLVRQGRTQEAITAARKAVEHEPEMAQHHAHLGGLLLRAGNATEAAQTFRAAWDRDPASPQVRRRLPHVLIQAGDVAGALQFVQDQIADPIEPPTSELYATLARLLARTGEHSEALRIAALAASMSPPHITALTTYGDQLTAAGRHEDAATVMRQAVELQPDSANVWFTLSRNCLARQKDEDACTAIQKAIGLDGGKFQFLGLHARILVRLRRFNEAQVACRDALNLRPHDPSLLTLETDIQRRIAGLSRQPTVAHTAT